MKADGTPRLSAELMATADALRHVGQQVDRLERDGHQAVAGSTEATVLAANGPPVVAALESLAERLAIQQ
jgi:hypothetical protein